MIKSCTPCGFVCVPQNCNEVNWVVSHNIFTPLFFTSLSYWTRYSNSLHFHLLAHFLYLPWSIAPFLRDKLYRCFWNSCTKLTLSLWIAEYMDICMQLPLEMISYKVSINWNKTPLSVALISSSTSLSCPGPLILQSIVIL